MNKEEIEIEKSYLNDKIQLRSPDKALLEQLKRTAENTSKKNRRINIRLSDHDMAGIQRVAASKGIPYQALISGLIHQFVEGDLVESGSR